MITPEIPWIEYVFDRTRGSGVAHMSSPRTSVTVLHQNIRHSVRGLAQGRIYWHPNTGAYGIWGKIGEAYALAGATAGPLKYPKSDEIKCPTKACWFNRFETGNIYWSAATGAHAVYGAIFAAYGRNGYENGRFGLPTSDEFAVNGGRQVNFQGGWIRWLSATNSIVTS